MSKRKFDFKRLLLNLFRFIISLLVTSFISLVLSTIGEFISIDLHFSESHFESIALRYFLPSLAFILFFFWLMGSKTPIPFLIMFEVAGSIYLIGQLYAEKIAKPFQLASQYVFEAESKTSWKDARDIKQYLEGEAEYVNLYEKAASQNFGYETHIKKYYEDWYQLKKDLYEMDKKMLLGELTLSKEERDKALQEYNRRLEYLKSVHISIPFWMYFYKVSF